MGERSHDQIFDHYLGTNIVDNLLDCTLGLESAKQLIVTVFS